MITPCHNSSCVRTFWPTLTLLWCQNLFHWIEVNDHFRTEVIVNKFSRMSWSMGGLHFVGWLCRAFLNFTWHLIRCYPCWNTFPTSWICSHSMFGQCKRSVSRISKDDFSQVEKLKIQRHRMHFHIRCLSIVICNETKPWSVIVG